MSMLDAYDRVQSDVEAEKPPEIIRAEMEGTRAALTEKIQTLEDTVKGTFENVKEKIDPRTHMRQHPWATVGGALAVGFVLGKLAGPALRGKSAWPPRSRALYANGGGGALDSEDVPPTLKAKEAKPGLFHRFAQQFGDELEIIEGAAITAGVTMLRDWAKDALPKFAPDIEKVSDRIIAKVAKTQEPERL